MSLSRQLFRDLFRVLEEPFVRSGPPAYFGSLNYVNRHSLLEGFGLRKPAVDVTDEGNKYVVEAELPGVKKDDIEVRIANGGRSLTIEGRVANTRRQPRNNDTSTEQSTSDSSTTTATNGIVDDATNQTSSERTFFNNTSFRRTFWLPHPVDGSNVAANLDHGILTITVPKADDEGSVVIPIQ